jgi:outer membrane protein OmpA-like peptidoglycan-associated protein
MSVGGRRLVRLARLVSVVGLIAVNGWLIALNLEKQGWFPFDGASSGDPGSLGPGTDAGRQTGVADGAGELLERPGSVASLLSTDGSVATSVATPEPVDDWPGGRGPLPDGPPQMLQVLIRDDGMAVVIGSAPRWSVALDVVDRVGRRLPGGPAWVANSVSWHPDASDDPADGVVRLERWLLYDAGEVGLPVDGVEILEPAVSLLTNRPELYAVVVAHVDDLGDSDQNAAVAAARAVAVVDRLAARGVDRSRLVMIVAPPDPDAPSGDDDETRRFNRRLEVRFENMLNPPAVG